MARAIFYTYQTSGECADVCKCDRTDQIDKTAKPKQFGNRLKETGITAEIGQV